MLGPAGAALARWMALRKGRGRAGKASRAGWTIWRSGAPPSLPFRFRVGHLVKVRRVGPKRRSYLGRRPSLAVPSLPLALDPALWRLGLARARVG
ncbi:MAG TPA: hypothetical protein VMD59_13310 [Acidimicrobiales bacterium]|nr:hypothetical protein [Acidimicrobiales bacterium]